MHNTFVVRDQTQIVSTSAVVNNAIMLVVTMPTVPSNVAGNAEAVIIVNAGSTEYRKMHVQTGLPVEVGEPVPVPFGLVDEFGLPRPQTHSKSLLCQK
jgi:hypothetical protein